MEFRSLLEALIQPRDLTETEAHWMLDHVVSDFATEGQIGAFLATLAAKGATGAELAAFATVLRIKVERVRVEGENLIDTCGTGGGASSFNISTAAAIVASAAGAKVAKHGNRAVTSNCGSADVLEALGVRITGDPEWAANLIHRIGIGFLFAPAHHPALKAVGKVRRELGVRTVFNQLGPLANPAGVTRQLIGVYDDALRPRLGTALQVLGASRALVVRGEDGLDEVSPIAPTRVTRLWDGGELDEILWTPADFGMDPVTSVDLAPGETVAQNAEILREAITDADSGRFRALLPSAAAALWVAGISDSLLDGAERARAAVASGAARRKLDHWVEASSAV